MVLGTPGHSRSTVAQFVRSRDFVKLAELRYCDHSGSGTVSESLCHTSPLVGVALERGGPFWDLAKRKSELRKPPLGFRGACLCQSYSLPRLSRSVPDILVQKTISGRPRPATKRSGLCGLLKRD